MQIATRMRKIVTVGQVMAELQKLAQEYDVTRDCYDESSADAMSEFDALKWISLCSQRSALVRREDETTSNGWEVPARFLGIYQTHLRSEPVRLENVEESLSELAA